MEPRRTNCESYFGWDYNTWCRCYICGEHGHIGENFIRTHMRKRDSTKRCLVCKELGHLAKNCMNRATVEDQKKEKADNIRSQMRWQWVKKSPKNASQSHEIVDTQVNELGDSTISS